jgi:hypothetical protein
MTGHPVDATARKPANKDAAGDQFVPVRAVGRLTFHHRPCCVHGPQR